MKSILLFFSLLLTTALSFSVSAQQPPVAPDTITGILRICPSMENTTYVASTVSGATSYNWTIPAGTTGTSTSETLILHFGTNFTGGYLKVNAENQYGVSANDSVYLTRVFLPSRINNIWGEVNICQGAQNVPLTADKSLNATSYGWILPVGFTGTSTTNTISLNISQNATSGIIAVYGVNECGNGDTTTLSININTEITGVSAITGLSSCSQFGTVELSYVVDPLVKNYMWHVPYGLTALTENNICRLIPNSHSIAGQSYPITLTATDWCGNTYTATHNLTVTAFIKEAATIDKRFEKIINGTVNDIELYKGKLYVCGHITRGNEDGNLFRWDGIKWESILPLEGSENIRDMQVYGGKLYICGEIYDVNGIEDADYIARYDGTNWEAIGNSNYRPNGEVTKMFLDNNLLIINGLFNKIGNDTLKFHAKYDGIFYYPILESYHFNILNINLMTPTNNGSYLLAGAVEYSSDGEFVPVFTKDFTLAEVTPSSGCKLEESEYEFVPDTTWFIGNVPYDYPVPGYESMEIENVPFNNKYIGVIPNEINKFLVHNGVYYAAGNFTWEYWNFYDVVQNKELLNEGLVSFTPHTNNLGERDFLVKYYGLKGTCKDMEIQDNKLICVGQFNQVINGDQFAINPPISVKNVAVLDLATETWSIVDNKPNFFQNAQLKKVANYNNDLYLGGTAFDSLASANGSNCLAERQDNKWVQIANMGIEGDVRKTIKISNSQTLVMGSFILPQDSSVQRIALWNDTTGFVKIIDRELAEDFQDIYAAAYFNNFLYISGYHTVLDEYIICRVQNHDQLDIVGTCAGGSAVDLKAFGNKMYIAGEFTGVNGVANTSHIAAWDGANWSALGNGFNGTVHSLGYDSTYIYAGGNFTDVGGVPNFNFIAKWDGINWTKVSQSSQLNNTVYSIYVLSNGNNTFDLFAGGAFGFKKLNQGFWSDFKPLPLGSIINAVDFNGNRPYISGIIPYNGMFSTVALRFNGKNWETPKEYFEGTGSSMVLNDGKLFMAGNFSKSNMGTTSENFAVYYLDTCSLPQMVTDITLSDHIGTGQTLCYGDTAFTLTASESLNATAYEWELPFGITPVYSQNGKVVSCKILFNFFGGTFKVYAKNDCGYADPTSITLYPAQQPQFYVYDSRFFNGDPNGDPNGIVKDSVCEGSVNNYFEVQSNYYTNYTWTLPTGFTGISDTTFMYYNVASGAISGNIKIKGEDACGIAEAEYLITVLPVPDTIGQITGLSQVIKGQGDVVYKVDTGLSGLPYEWTFPQGFTGTSTADSIVLNVTSNAVSGYIKVKQSNDCGYGPEASFQVTAKGPATTNQITVTACDSVTINGQTFTSGGTFTQTLVNSAGGDSILTINLTLNNAYAGNQSFTICEGNSLIVGTHVYTTSGTYTDTLQTVQGCDSIITTQLTVKEAPDTLNLGNDTTVCNSLSLSVALCNECIYNWSNGNATHAITVTTSGQYICSVSNTCGNTADTINVTVHTSPVLNVNFTDTTICSGNTLTLSASSNANMVWSTGDSAASITVTPTQDTVYLAYAYNICGVDSDSVMVFVVPQANAGADTTNPVVCSNYEPIVNLEYYLSSNHQPGGVWVDLDNTGALNGANFAADNVPQDNFYSFAYVVSGTQPCPNDTALITVYVQLCSGVPPYYTGQLSVYPNPVNDKLSIVFSNTLYLSANTILEIINVHGQIIKTMPLKALKNTLDINDLTNGMYIIRIKSDHGIIVRKIIKQ